MRRIAGGALMLFALLGVVAGVAMAVLLGTDDRAVSGPHEIDASGPAVVTEPGVVSWAGPKVSVVAEVPDDKPVFVGVANSVDVEDYLADTEHVSVDGYEVPWTIDTSNHGGRPNLPASPLAMDWWISKGSGVGGAATTLTLPDETVSVAILAVGANDLEGLEVTTSYDVRGGFGIGIGLVVVGLGVLLLGWVLVRDRPLLRGREVFVPGDAVEPDETADWDEQESSSDPAAPDGGEDVLGSPATPGALAAATATGTGGAAVTSGGAAGADTGVVEEVVYVYVDEDGVEHEIAAEDAHEYEVVDESELPAREGDRRPNRWWRRR